MSKKALLFIPKIVVGPLNIARTFNGTTDQINAATTTPSSNITASAWVNPSALSNAYGAIFEEVDAGGQQAFSIYLKSSGKLAMYYNAGGSNYDGSGVNTLSPGTWYHVLFLGPPSGSATGYVNGSLDGTGSGSFSNSGTSFKIGSDQGLNQAFDGAVADMAIWDTALTGPQISALAAGNRANTIGANANLIGYWPMTGASPEPDESGNGNDGVLTGTGTTTGPF